MMTWKWNYALAAFTLLCVELAIACFVHDGFVRPYLGDTLAVILVYLGLRTITRLKVVPAIAIALAFAVAIELSQIFHLISVLHLSRYPLAHFILGTGFDPKDFPSYAAGGVIVVIIEALRKERLV